MKNAKKLVALLLSLALVLSLRRLRRNGESSTSSEASLQHNGGKRRCCGIR